MFTREITMRPLEESGYKQLQKLLEERLWLDADQTTYQLMSNILGKREEELKCKDIKDFPCSELHKINQLWVKYSNGKFGFSVQQKIWQEVCETTDDRSWTGWDVRRGVFCERVGWAKTYAEENDPFKRFVSYKDLCLSKAGQLPNGRAVNFFACHNYYMAYHAEYWWDTANSHITQFGFDFDRLMKKVASCIQSIE